MHTKGISLLFLILFSLCNLQGNKSQVGLNNSFQTTYIKPYIQSTISQRLILEDNSPRKKKIVIRSAVTIPLKRAGNLLLIDAQVDTISGTFIFDTGAGGLVLNSAYFKNGRRTYDNQGIGVNQSSIPRKTLLIDSLVFRGLKFPKINADVIDLSHIENSKGVKILGLIGSSFLRDFEIVLDIHQMYMTFYPVDKKGVLLVNYTDTNNYQINQKIELVNNVIITHIPFGRKKVCFCIDTGAENCLIDNNAPNELLELLEIKGRRSLRGSGPQKIEVLFATMNRMEVSGQTIELMDVIVTDLSNMKRGYGINIGGMLGYDFLSQGIVKLNLRKKTLSISMYKEGKL